MGRVAKVLGAVGAVVLLAGCWPVPGQNANRTRHNPFETTITTETVGDLEQQWQYTTPVPIDHALSDPVLSSGRVHMTTGCVLVTLDARTGQERWVKLLASIEDCEFGASAGPFTGEPHVVPGPDGGDQVLAGYGFAWVTHNGVEQGSWVARAFDPSSGEAQPGGGSSLLSGARGGSWVGWSRAGAFLGLGITRVDLRGEESRTFSVDVGYAGAIPAIPRLTLGTDQIFHSGPGVMTTEPGDTTRGTGIRAFSRTEATPGCGPLGPGEGRPVECPLWVTDTDGWPTSPVIGSGGSVLYTRTSDTLYVLDAATGEIQWTAEGLGGGGRPALAGGLVYVPASGGRVLVFDADGCGAPVCDPVWEVATGSGANASSPTVAGDVLFVGSGGSLHAFPSDGCGEPVCSEELWQAPGSGAPVVGFGKVYASLGNDTLVAYGLG